MESILAEYGLQGGSLALALAFLWYIIKGNRKASDDAHNAARVERKELSEEQKEANESITILATKFDAHTSEQRATNKRHSGHLKDHAGRIGQLERH